MDNKAYISDNLEGSEKEKNYGVAEYDGSSEESISSSTNSKSTFAQFLATSINSMSAVSLGLLYTIPTVVIENVYNTETGLSLDDIQVSWYASLLPIFQPLGCCLGGYLQNYIGRKQGLVLMNISTIISWILLYRAYTAEILYLSSILMGISIGFTEAPAIIYVAEISTPSLRGMLVSYACFNCTFGMALIFFLALFMFWRTLCIFGVGLCIISVLLLTFIPDSPTWLINKGREKEAIKALRWLRGWVSEKEVKQEFESLSQHIKNSVKQLSDSEGKHKLKVNDLFAASTLRPFIFVTSFYFFGCAASIVGARNYYLVLFNRLNVPVNPTWLALLSWIAAVLGNISCCFLVKIFGKRSMSLLSMFLSSSICILMGLYIAFQYELNQPMIFAILIIGMGFTPYLGVGVLPWIQLGEIYPVKIRSFATGITGAIFYIIIFIYVKTYYYLELLMTTQGAFIFYGILGFVGFFYLWMFMPETEGKTMMEIEELFMDDSRKKCSHFRKKK